MVRIQSTPLDLMCIVRPCGGPTRCKLWRSAPPLSCMLLFHGRASARHERSAACLLGPSRRRLGVTAWHALCDVLGFVLKRLRWISVCTGRHCFHPAKDIWSRCTARERPRSAQHVERTPTRAQASAPPTVPHPWRSTWVFLLQVRRCLYAHVFRAQP